MFAGRNMMFASAAFSPLSLSPALWLDASDASTLYSGASLAAADGAISEWCDKSGNARHATQSTGVSQPLRKTAIQNGRDVVRFDGANDGIAGNMQNLSAMSVFAVWIPRAVTANARIYSQRGTLTADDFNAAGHYIPLIRSGTTTNIGSFAAGGFRGMVTSSSVGACQLLGSTHSGTELKNFANGASGSPYAHTLGNNGARFAIGYPASSAITDGWVNGDIAEILVFPTALSTTDRQAVERYLNAKWVIF